MHVDMFHCDLLLALAAMMVQRSTAYVRESLFAWLKFSRRPSNVCSPNLFSLSSWNFPGSEELRRLQQLKTEAPMVAKTVLVVEDDPCIRIVAEEMFVAAGFEVESVQRADHALDIVAQRSEQTAFLFTDVQTPGPIDGIDLARLVKTHWPHVEVLVTSGRPVSNIVLPGGVRFTSKPWSRKEVLELARAAVAKQ
jgi:CheY-like chemotaxis protein